MRLVNYAVRKKDGTLVNMTSYPEALKTGKIVRTYLTETDPPFWKGKGRSRKV